jgi:hypothetical protein
MPTASAFATKMSKNPLRNVLNGRLRPSKEQGKDSGNKKYKYEISNPQYAHGSGPKVYSMLPEKQFQGSNSNSTLLAAYSSDDGSCLFARPAGG